MRSLILIASLLVLPLPTFAVPISHDAVEKGYVAIAERSIQQETSVTQGQDLSSHEKRVYSFGRKSSGKVHPDIEPHDVHDLPDPPPPANPPAGKQVFLA